MLERASKAVSGHKFSLHFLVTEWEQIVDAWQLASWVDYRDVTRLGRKTRLPEPQRAVLWSIFEQVRSALAAQKLVTHAGMFTSLVATLANSKHPPFDFAVVDEAQDLSVAHLRFLAALGANRPDALFFAGDLGSAFFSNRFRGSRWGWIFGAARARCASITAPRTKSASRPTVCWVTRRWMWMATPRPAATRYRCLMAHHR
jgi:hypothetical protein